MTVLEAETAGFGASGRNGGWCSALFPASRPRSRHRRSSPGRPSPCTNRCGRPSTRSTPSRSRGHRRPAPQGRDAVAGPDTRAAAPRPRRGRGRARLGPGPDDVRLLDRDRGERPLDAPARSAQLHPGLRGDPSGRLVRGLARAVEARGVPAIHERTRVTAMEPAWRSPRTAVRARRGGPRHRGLHAPARRPRRDALPVYSLIVATSRCRTTAWSEIGLASARRSPTPDTSSSTGSAPPTTGSSSVAAARRTTSGSTIRPTFDREPRVFATLRDTLAALFPRPRRRAVHACLGRAARRPPRLDRLGRSSTRYRAGLGRRIRRRRRQHTNLAGRTLADLVLEPDTELTPLPWVNHRSRRWEPEPLRWLGVERGLRTMTVADREERHTGRRSVVARLMAPLVGGH